MKIVGSTVLVTGAGGGIGRCVIETLQARDARKIYAADISSAGLGNLGPGVETFALDVTDEAAVAKVATAASDVTLLINSAGVFGLAGLIAAVELSAARREMEVNFWGGLIMMCL